MRADRSENPISQRQTKLPPEIRAVHRQILWSFLDSGNPPHRAKLPTTESALDTLSTVDLVHLDASGRVTVAYPFSAEATPHVVELDGFPPLHAMCAIDALGIPLMTGRDGTVTSTDPTTGAAVRVEYRAGRWRWDPVETVVLHGRRADRGRSADCSCPVTVFHSHAAHARAHQRAADLGGAVLDQSQALEQAEYDFATLLTE